MSKATDNVHVSSSGFYEPVTEFTPQSLTFTSTHVEADLDPYKPVRGAENALLLAVLKCQAALLEGAIKHLSGPAPVMAAENIELAIELEKLK